MESVPLSRENPVAPLAPGAVRYIKLGEGGQWAKEALARGELVFGYAFVSHEKCQAQDWAGVAEELRASGRSPAKVSDSLREIRDFYSLGSDCLWITFADQKLWWAFAHPEVCWNADDQTGRAVRSRRLVEEWRCTDLKGQPLRVNELSSLLTQVASYRQTLCSVKAESYLLQRINGETPKAVTVAREARDRLSQSAATLIQGLHWADFETLVDLLFSRGGWHRTSQLGGTIKDVDLILEHPLTGERAFVQVKSQATQAVLDDYLARFEGSGLDRFFFVCHTPRGALTMEEAGHRHLWTSQALAEATIRAGLFDWVLQRSQ